MKLSPREAGPARGIPCTRPLLLSSSQTELLAPAAEVTHPRITSVALMLQEEESSPSPSHLSSSFSLVLVPSRPAQTAQAQLSLSCPLPRTYAGAHKLIHTFNI